jgi:hypothetical protein
VREVMHSCRVSRALTRRESSLTPQSSATVTELLRYSVYKAVHYMSNLNSHSRVTHAINNIRSTRLVVKIFVVWHQKFEVYVLSRK